MFRGEPTGGGSSWRRTCRRSLARRSATGRVVQSGTGAHILLRGSRRRALRARRRVSHRDLDPDHSVSARLLTTLRRVPLDRTGAEGAGGAGRDTTSGPALSGLATVGEGWATGKPVGRSRLGTCAVTAQLKVQRSTRLAQTGGQHSGHACPAYKRAVAGSIPAAPTSPLLTRDPPGSELVGTGAALGDPVAG